MLESIEATLLAQAAQCIPATGNVCFMCVDVDSMLVSPIAFPQPFDLGN